MPFPKASPYDVLEISPSANLKEIMTGYQQALKKRRYPPNKVVKAFNELRNTRKRGEHDLLEFCRLGDTSELQKWTASLPPTTFIPTEVSPLPLTNTQMMTPSMADLAADFEEVPECPLQFKSSNRYENLYAVLPPISFPA